MAITLGTPNKPQSGANTTRVMKVPASQIEQFLGSLNEQFPTLIEGDAPAYANNFAYQTDPKGNVTIYQASKGVHSVTLTGALTSLQI